MASASASGSRHDHSLNSFNAGPATPPTHPLSKKQTQTRRQATVYDAVAGRVSSSGFLPRHPFTSKNRDTLSSSSVAVPPEEVLFRRRGAPERFAEDDVYWRGSRNLREDQVLPDSDLLKAVHPYASKFYGRMWGGGGSGIGSGIGGEEEGADFMSLDGTALLAMGILLEEWAGEVLGAEGDGVFVEGEYDGEGEEERVEAGGSMGDRAWRARRMAERRMTEKKNKVKNGKEVNGVGQEEQEEETVVRRKVTKVPNNKSNHLRSHFKSKTNEPSGFDQSNEEYTTDSVDNNNYNSDDTTTTSNTHYNTRDLIDFSAGDDDDDDDEEEEEEEEEEESSDSAPEDNVNDDDNENLDRDQDDDSAEVMSPSSYPDPNINTNRISISLPYASSSSSESESDSDSNPQSDSQSDSDSQSQSHSEPHSDSDSEILPQNHTRKRRKISRSQ